MANGITHQPSPSMLVDQFNALLPRRQSYLKAFSTEEIVRTYGLLLSELTSNVNPIITDLTIIAGQQRKHALSHSSPKVPNLKPSFVNGTAAAVRSCRRLRGLLLPLSQIHTARPSLCLLRRASAAVCLPFTFASSFSRRLPSRSSPFAVARRSPFAFTRRSLFEFAL